MAAVLARGETLIENAAREPEVVDVANCLIKMGAQDRRHRQPDAVDPGRETLHGAEHTVLPDRIETGTYAMAAAMTGGDVLLDGARADLLQEALQTLRSTGIEIEEQADRHPCRAERRGASNRCRSRPSPSRASPRICRRSSSR